MDAVDPTRDPRARPNPTCEIVRNEQEKGASLETDTAHTRAPR